MLVKSPTNILMFYRNNTKIKKVGATTRTLMENGNKLKYIREEKIVKPMVELTFGSIGMFIAGPWWYWDSFWFSSRIFPGGIGWILTLLAGAYSLWRI